MSGVLQMKSVCFLLLLGTLALAQQPAASEGSKSFDNRCAVCHGGDGAGSDRGPSLIAAVNNTRDDVIANTIRTGIRGMPPHQIADPEMKALVAYLHTLRPAENQGN